MEPQLLAQPLIRTLSPNANIARDNTRKHAMIASGQYLTYQVQQYAPPGYALLTQPRDPELQLVLG
jgi:hypothetical protein